MVRYLKTSYQLLLSAWDFPCRFYYTILSLFISSVASKDVPEFMKQRVVTSVAITMSLIIPMAIMLIGYAANYAQEVERNVPTRMYFLIMILSGMMGMESDQLPESMKTIAYTLPTTYIGNEFIDFLAGTTL